MGLIKFILSHDSRASLKRISATADKIIAMENVYSSMTDAELKEQTEIFKKRISDGEKLDSILPEAFAVVREASGRVLNMKHYKVQLMGGICVHQGRIAELKTGEGKTLMATLPAYLNALTGKGVHIVTVNDYLAKRDAEWMGKVYRFLGLTVGVNIHDLTDEQKREAYNCDITYGTNNEYGFDYLRDNLKKSMSQMVQRGLNFAIVDEVDSILIDEARTPLIISGRGQKSSTLYFDANRFVKTLIPDEDYTVDIKEKNVQITDQGSRKAEKFFHVDNIADVTNAELNHHIQQALKAHTLFKKDEDYIVSDGEIIIVDEFTGRLMMGRRYSEGLHQAIEAKENVTIRNENQTYATITFQNYFRLYTKLSGMTGTAKTEEEEFKTIYGLDVLEIPTNKPMQRKDMPDMVFSTEKGKMQAIVNEIVKVHETGQPVLVGTVTVERSEEISKQLLRNRIRHNILNAKNHQREAEIIAQAGKKGAVTIATNMAGRGTDILLGGNPEYLAKQDLRNKGIAEEDIDMASSFVQDVSDEIKALREEYNKLLEEHKKVTDAEKEEVIKAGGLYILGTERHESRRIDNQLRGRAGRQGDPGKSQFFISLEDDLARRFGGERMKRLYSMFKIDEYTPIQSKMLSRSIENAQRTIEGQNFGIRRNVIQYDDVMNTQRMVIYEERMKVLRGENVHENILKLIPDYVERVVKECVDYSQNLTKWDYEKLNRVLQDKVLPLGIEFLDEDKCAKWDYEYFMKKLLDKTIDEYEKKITRYREEENIDYYAIERDVLLTNVDKKWIDHIDNMDRLKRGISLRSFANEDPINPFKREGLEMFEEMVESIQTDTVFLLLKMELRKEPVRKSAPTNLQASNGGNVTVRKNAVKEIGRNDPCPCGSGKKYKNCCGRK